MMADLGAAALAPSAPRTVPRPPRAPGAAPVAFVAFAALAALAGCGGGSKAAPAAGPGTPGASSSSSSDPATTARITSFTLSPENLKVDRVGMRDSVSSPDGSLDLAFGAELEGPLDALFLTTVNDAGQASAGFRANTLRSDEHAPDELGGDLEFGSMSVGIGAVENGRFVNLENGALRLSAGPHKLALYVANAGSLRPGAHLRLFGRTRSGALVASPVLTY